MQICNRCVMDSTDPAIVFDDNGNCDQCNNYFNVIKPYYDKNIKEDSFREIAKKIRKEGESNDFDCLLGMSVADLIAHIYY